MEKPKPPSPVAGWYDDASHPGKKRYWDGTQWTDRILDPADITPAAEIPLSTERKSQDERRALLAQQVQFLVAQGRRVESQSEFQAVLVRGKPVNHTLHAILVIITCGIWILVWPVIAGTGGESRELVIVDEFGNIQVQQLGKV